MSDIGPGKPSVLTPEGGIAIWMINGTGATSIKGTIVGTSPSVDNGVEISPANVADMIGVIYDNGVPDGELVRVVITGVAQVLIRDSTPATRGYWCRMSITQAGRANITNASPPGGGIPEIDEHFKEIGHSLESATAGTDVLVKISVHLN